MSRDEFTLPTKRDLAQRAAHKCSICKASTAGSAALSTSSINIGEAAHIEGAAKGAGSKRFNSNMTPAQRSHINNGIWLCRNCHGNVDRDIQKYTPEELHRLKDIAEKKAADEIGVPPSSQATSVTTNINFNGAVNNSNLNLGSGAQHNSIVNHTVNAQSKFEDKNFAEAKMHFLSLIESGKGDDYSSLFFVISALSERHASRIKLSEINKFYEVLEGINDDSYKILTDLTWLILFHESRGRQSITRQMREEEKRRRAYILDPENRLSTEHKLVVENIVTYTEEAKCLLM